MKNKQTIIWIIVGIVVVLLIVWAIVASNKAKSAPPVPVQQVPQSKLAEILTALFPFYSVFQSGNNQGEGGANADATGTPLYDYCQQYPDSVLCRG